MSSPAASRGIALMAVLFALVLLMLLALPFAVSMSVGADAAMRDVELTAVAQDSASVRELLVADAAMSHPAVDPTPTFDGLDEFPESIDVPPAFAAVKDGGRVLLGGQIVDLQRFLGLDGASPLLFGNVLGTTARLREELKPDAGALELDDASHLPDSGYVFVGGELIRYESKDGNALKGLQRGLQQENLFADGKQSIREDALVLDWRCVMAAAWPCTGRDITRRTRVPFRAPSELLEITSAGIGTFTAEELAALQRVFVVDTMAATAATWGRPERVFNNLDSGKSKTLLVRSALHLGAGSTVRLTNLRTGDVEHGLVIATATQRGVPELNLRAVFQLHLLLPVLGSFPGTDTVVEPLIPAPVNINTAGEEVLAALFTHVRVASDVRVHDGAAPPSLAPRWIRPADGKQLASDLVAMRTISVDGGGSGGPFTGWRDLVDRVWKPRLDAAAGDPEKRPWLYLYRNLQTGRDSSLEMGTSPIVFQSGPWVSYRAAASRSRSIVAPGVVGRHERTGTAAAMPGFLLQRRWATQELLEDAFQLDRRAPYWVTLPVNLGHPIPNDVGNDPAPRYFPHLIPVAYPGLGFGESRYPATDDADAGMRPAPSTALAGRWPGTQVPTGTDSFAQTLDIRGHDVKRQGPYAMQNTGPKRPPTGSQQQPSVAQARGGAGGRHDKISFPFANGDSFAERFATSFWIEPQSLGNCVLFDHGDGDPDRNRISVQVRDGNLVFEVIDEAGLDPNYGASPAGIQRTASEWSLPVAELALPANTPLHVSTSAYSGRPADLSFAVDGMTRGKPKFVTYLTGSLKVFDPELASNQTLPGVGTNERYLDLQVESTEGFPPVGVLRIGLELFEYSSISGNSFKCRWKDSLGGRGARQRGRENRPAIPTDPNGEPTVDFDDPRFQGVNLDVFPEHPAGSMVELYGYSALLSEDSPMMVDSTRLDSGIGGFAVARAFIDNPRTIVVTLPMGPPITLGKGLDLTWTGDIQLADPVPTGQNQPPPAAQDTISNAFSTTGGYALLMQRTFSFRGALGPNATTSSTTPTGGVEVIKYTSRQGHKLIGCQRAQKLPGNDALIDPDRYDGRARQFITDFTDWAWDPNNGQVKWDDIPALITWVIPITLAVQNTEVLWDPAKTGLTEWAQLYPRGGDVNDTEWVRYDAIADNRYLCRANRSAWDRTYFELIRTFNVDQIDVGNLGPNSTPAADVIPPWSTVTPTTGYIGYVPTLESTFPQIQAARGALRFRGDPFTGTTSHPHANSDVMGCHRLQLLWGNYGAYTGRVGRLDRVALVQGSATAGGNRPALEWHTVNWQARRYNADNLQQNQTPAERLGPWPFQLVAFQDAVRIPMMGPPAGTVINEPRRIDRIVKFPSGELPAAHCEAPTIGAGIGNILPMTGFVDEVEVTAQLARDLVIEEAIDQNARAFTVNRNFTLNSAGAEWTQSDLSALIPKGGGLIAIDTEIVAFASHQDGVFQIAQNGRGLLGTETRGHDRGARVRFLTHRPAAILSGGVSARSSEFPVQSIGSLPTSGGTVLIGRELAHYCWTRNLGDNAVLEMPRHFPPGADRAGSEARGLLRARFGTSAATAASGEVVIGFPFRHWDRHVPQSDDPELAYFQLTTNEAPAYFRTIRWREEKTDPRVEAVCLVRADGKLPWSDEPLPPGGLWQLTAGSEQSGNTHRLGHHASRLEIRFATVYKPGCLDLASYTAHGWKTTVTIEDVVLEYEGQGRVFAEQVTAR